MRYDIKTMTIPITPRMRTQWFTHVSSPPSQGILVAEGCQTP